MKRIVLVLGVVAGLLFLTPTAALACSCVRSNEAQQVDDAGTIVDATLSWTSTNEIDTYYGIVVHSVFKGRAAANEKLATKASTSSCALGDLATNKRYLFFIDGEHPGELTVNGCGGTTLYDAARAARITAITGAPTGPNASPPRSSAADADSSSGASVWTVLGTAAALALVIGGLLYLRQRS